MPPLISLLLASCFPLASSTSTHNLFKACFNSRTRSPDSFILPPITPLTATTSLSFFFCLSYLSIPRLVISTSSRMFLSFSFSKLSVAASATSAGARFASLAAMILRSFSAISVFASYSYFPASLSSRCMSAKTAWQFFTASFAGDWCPSAAIGAEALLSSPADATCHLANSRSARSQQKRAEY